MTRAQLLLLLPALLVAAPAWANDSAFMGHGATVFAIKEERVTMERESIVIRHDAKAPFERRWVADCTFTFRNLSAKEAQVEVGFPDWRVQGEVKGPWAIRDFTVSVEGKEVKATHKPIVSPEHVKSGERRAAPKGQLPRRVKLAYEAAYTWPVTFPPGARVVIRNRYRFGGGASNGPLSGCVDPRRARSQPDVFWKPELRPKGGIDFADASCFDVTYIVTSGRTWAGSIGEAEIAIQLPADTWPHLFLPLPAASSVDGGWVRWRFKSWTPREELTLVVLTPTYAKRDGREETTYLPPFFDSLGQAKVWTRFAARNHLSAAHVRLLRDAYRARYGPLEDKAAAAAVKAFFPGRVEYPPPPKVRKPPSALDAKVIELLEKTPGAL